MSMEFKWRFIGNGKKLHAVPVGSDYALCGIGGVMSEHQPPIKEPCKWCLHHLKNFEMVQDMVRSVG